MKNIENIQEIFSDMLLLESKKRVMVKKYIEDAGIYIKDGFYMCKDKNGKEKKICLYSEKNPGLIKTFAEHNFTEFEDIFGNGYINLAFSEDEQKYYGWARGIYGFGMGSETKEGHVGYDPKKGKWKAKTMKDARQMAIDYAHGCA